MWKIKFINKENISELQCNWKKLPSILIEIFYYTLPNKKTLRFEGFESYLCFKEIYKLSTIKNEFVDTINILAKHNNEVCQISYNPIHGKILQKKNIWGKEFTPLIWDSVKKEWKAEKERKTNRNLWKEGKKLNKAKINVID